MELWQGPLEGLGVISEDFWQRRRVFLTGHTGFKGSWLALWLKRLGAEVTGFARQPPTNPSLYEIAQVGNSLRDMRGDICDLERLATVLRAAQPEIVIHMAAQSLVRRSYEAPVESYTTNVIGTANLLESVRQAGGVRSALVVTSDKCYENREWFWGYRENEAMGGHDPYSSSKGCAELVTGAYRDSYFRHTETAVASVRSGNVIGGGDWAQDRLVPDIMRAAAEGRVIHLRNPGAVRPWQHVLDSLHGYLLLAERLYHEGQAFAGAWNFGPSEDDTKPVSRIARELASLWNAVKWEEDSACHPHEAQQLKLDCSKARSLLGWAPLLPLDQALSWTAQWYMAQANGSSARRLTEEQIENYNAVRKARN